jgi:multicomponent Na+:H+ antiporter subunit C
MTVTQLYSITGFLLFLIGVCGLIFHPSLLRKALALNITGGGVFLFMVAQAYKGEGSASDPVPHGLVLTGIVIGAGATALMLFLVGRLESLSSAESEGG